MVLTDSGKRCSGPTRGKIESGVVSRHMPHACKKSAQRAERNTIWLTSSWRINRNKGNLLVCRGCGLRVCAETLPQGRAGPRQGFFYFGLAFQLLGAELGY